MTQHPRKRQKTNTDMDWDRAVEVTEVPVAVTPPIYPHDLQATTPESVGENLFDFITTELISRLEQLTHAISSYVVAWPKCPQETLLLALPDVTYLTERGLPTHARTVYQDILESHCDGVVRRMFEAFSSEYGSQGTPGLDDDWCWDRYSHLVGDLSGLLNHYAFGSALLMLGTSFEKQSRNFFEGAVRTMLPPCFAEVTQRVLDYSLEKSSKFGSDSDSQQARASHMAEVRVLVENLKNIGLYEEARTAILATAKKTIKERVEECRGEYEERHLNDCLEWVTCRVSDNWLSAIDTTSEVDASHRQAIPTFDWSHVLRMSTYQGFCSMRISEMFDLIRDAIDTLPAPALLDLKDCLKTSVQKDELVESLKTVLEARILHAGVATEDIVSLFIATENCLRLLDPSSNLLLRTIEPMKQYLRRRPDTVKHILTRMLDQNSELAEAMREPDNCVDDEDFDDSADWNPEPIDAVGSRQERNVDIITRLISVFENKEVFVNEFHKILLESLLHKTGYDTEQETMELELLKIRFGEASFHQCEVMLLDMAVSRRLHKHIREGSLAASRAIELEPEEDMFHVTTISHLFWPTINTCEFRIPFPNISSAQAAYAKQFQEQKPNRKLKWKPNAGLVEVELEMGDGRCKTYTVTELQAAVIYHFGAESRNGTSSIGDIVEDLRSQGSSSDFEEDIRDCVQLWIGHSVLKEVSLDCWEVVETLDPDASGSGGSTSIIHGARKSEEERARAKEEAEMRSKFQPMIVALLTNQGAQNAEKIQSILAMFFQFSHPMADLQKMLDHMVAEGMLALAMNGKYSVRV